MFRLSFLLKVSSICFELFLFYFILFIYLFYCFFLDVFSKSVTDTLMNLAPLTGFYNAVLQPPSTSNPKN